MKSEYLLYPNAVEKLISSGIEQRVETFKNSKERLLNTREYRFDDQIINSINELKKNGFYMHFPTEFSQKYQNTMIEILRRPDNFYWSIKKPNEVIKEPCQTEDMDLFSGEIASLVLSPEELWNYSRFNFSSPTELAITVGAYITQRLKEKTDYEKGYKWVSNKFDGSKVRNQITGSVDNDLRIYQTDITPYPTTDPFNSDIEIRPIIESDRNFAGTCHSTEATLFVAVMKYVEQQGIKTQYQEDNAKSLIEWGHSLGQDEEGFDEDPVLSFIGYNNSIPILNKSDETEEYTPYSLGVDMGEGRYDIYIAHNGDFVLSYQDSSKIDEPRKPINIRFNSDDAEHLIRGLIFQSAKRLGRTSSKQLFDILEYRYSPQFILDQEV